MQHYTTLDANPVGKLQLNWRVFEGAQRFPGARSQPAAAPAHSCAAYARVNMGFVTKPLPATNTPPEEVIQSPDDLLQEALLRLKAKNPEWFREFDDADPMVCSIPQVLELLTGAPDEFSRGIITGILMFRQQLAILVGHD